MVLGNSSWRSDGNSVGRSQPELIEPILIVPGYLLSREIENMCCTSIGLYLLQVGIAASNFPMPKMALSESSGKH